MTKDEYLAVGICHGAFAGFFTFIGGWIYCVATYGFLLGLGLGWLPSGILAGIVHFTFVFLWLPIDLLVGFLILAIFAKH
jgi:hypothetical protein